MTKKERYKAFIDYFSVHQPEVETELQYTNPFELLVAVVLSAQCTDKRVNMVTPRIFEKYPTAFALSFASVEDIFELIRSISYPNNKAKHLLGMAKMLVQDFNSLVPSSVEDLQKLPGVGRKTANVIASVVYDQPTMAVDTHVYRVSKRLGLVATSAKTPLAVENELIKNIAQKHVPKAHHWLILHGRYVCLARSPKCDKCEIAYFCKFFHKTKKINTVA